MKMSIATFIFLDVEATGLPEQELNRTKVTEIALLAVSRRALENASVGNLPAMKKLTFIVNPQKKLQSYAARATGFTDEFLSDKPFFREKIDEINEFLNLPKPVCLVAHSGDKFDFKILKAEYVDAKASLPSDLMCVDSFKAFKSMFKGARAPRCSTREKIENLTESFAKLSPIEDTSKPMVTSFTLTSLYRTLLVEEPKEGHRAEADCEMLLQCVVATKEEFVLWADNNCIPLKMIKPLKRKLHH